MSTIRSSHIHKSGWKGRTFLWGHRCFLDTKKQKQDLFFYKENFSLKVNSSKTPTTLNIKIKVRESLKLPFSFTNFNIYRVTLS